MNDVGHHDSASMLADRKITHEKLDALKAAFKETLTPHETAVVGRLVELWCKPPQTIWQVAWATGRDQGETRRARSRAFAKVCRHLLTIEHPATIALGE